MAKSKKKPVVKGNKAKKPMRKLVKSKSYEHEGRPTKYNPVAHPMVAEALANAGRIDDEIADAMQINRSTFYAWKKEYPEFSDAVARGKSPVDIKVENAFLAGCLPHDIFEEKQVMEAEKPKRMEKTKKHTLGDIGGQKFWLKNRMRDRWRDEQNVNMNSTGGGIEDLTDEELEKHDKRYRDIVGEEGAAKDAEGKGEEKSKA